MCEFCMKHGEGKKWYLEVKNYSEDLMSDICRAACEKDAIYLEDRSKVPEVANLW